MQAPLATDLGRERSIAEILRVALVMYRHYPLLFALLAIGVIAPYELARLAATGVPPLQAGKHPNAGALLLFRLLYYSLVGPLISALHVHAVVEIGEGRRPRLGPVALQGLRVLAVVAAAEIVATILIGLGFLAFFIPGIILSFRFAVVAQTAAIDHEGWLPALRSSRKLTAGNYPHIFGLVLIAGGLTFLADLAARGVAIGSPTGIGTALIGIAVNTIIASFAALVLAILYFDLRAREVQSASQPAPEYQYPADLD